MKRQKTKPAKRATPRKGAKPKVTTFTIDGRNDPRRSVTFARAF